MPNDAEGKNKRKATENWIDKAIDVGVEKFPWEKFPLFYVALRLRAELRFDAQWSCRDRLTRIAAHYRPVDV